MSDFFLNPKISGETVVPCYFFYGEEIYLAHHFASSLRAALIMGEESEFGLERWNLDRHSWMDIIDSARNAPFFLSSWRILMIEIPTEKSRVLSAADESILKDYLASSSSHTILLIFIKDRLRKTSPYLKLFSKLPPEKVCIKEIKALSDYQINPWIDAKLTEYGKSATPEARSRIKELSGNDLFRLNSELEKLVTFLGEKKTVDADDVNQVSGWVKTFIEWEMSNALEKKDYQQSLVILDNLLRKEGIPPERIIGITARFFRDIFQAKLWLEDNIMNRKEIFKALRPQILERFGLMYKNKFADFFRAVDSMTENGLRWYLDQLEAIDIKIKTSDFPAQVLLEKFLYSYCRGTAGSI